MKATSSKARIQSLEPFPLAAELTFAAIAETEASGTTSAVIVDSMKEEGEDVEDEKAVMRVVIVGEEEEEVSEDRLAEEEACSDEDRVIVDRTIVEEFGFDDELGVDEN